MYWLPMIALISCHSSCLSHIALMYKVCLDFFSLHNNCIFWFCLCLFTRHFWVIFCYSLSQVNYHRHDRWLLMSNLYVPLQICFGPCISCSLATPREDNLEGKLNTQTNDFKKIRPKDVLLHLVQTHTSPCFSIKELIMQSSGMLGSICCWRGKLWIKKKNWKTHLDNHCTLMVLVILGLVLCKPGFRATNFSTDIARPRNSLDMGFCVALEVCLQKECSWWAYNS